MIHPMPLRGHPDYFQAYRTWWATECGPPNPGVLDFTSKLENCPVHNAHLTAVSVPIRRTSSASFLASEEMNDRFPFGRTFIKRLPLRHGSGGVSEGFVSQCEQCLTQQAEWLQKLSGPLLGSFASSIDEIAPLIDLDQLQFFDTTSPKPGWTSLEEPIPLPTFFLDGSLPEKSPVSR